MRNNSMNSKTACAKPKADWRVFVLMVACAVCLSVSPYHANADEIGTAFSYQGRLVKNGTPVTSVSPHCNFTLRLWDAASGGNQKGNSPQNATAIPVTQGLFAVQIDFGASGIDGTARWLEIAVQCPGDASATTLAPRQELLPTPHALAIPGLYSIQDAFSPSLIGGHHENVITVGVQGASISGGGAAAPDNNKVTDTFGTVGGGCSNRAGDNDGLVFDAQFATVGGGFANVASNQYATVGGGSSNTASGLKTTIGGGESNNSTGQHTTIGGGLNNSAASSFATVAGGATNNASGQAAAIAGGYGNEATGARGSIGGGYTNTAAGDYSTVSGGENNEAAQLRSTIGGGINNTADGSVSTIGGGGDNLTTGFKATIGGGGFNTASGSNSVIGGGDFNSTKGAYASVPGGALNDAGGDYSFAGGRRGKVRDAATTGDADGDEGTFVWSDANLSNFISSGPNQFLVRASGGARVYSNSTASVGVQLAAGGNSWSSLSDRNAKENFVRIEPREILNRLCNVPITLWNLKSQSPNIQHLGPIAQDFHAAFQLGEIDTHISGSDADGVALAAIQGLNQIVREKECEIEELKERLNRLENLLDDLSANASVREPSAAR